MSDKRFLITGLFVIGPGGRESSLKFMDGLNLIFGPSNSGKSYIFKCLDYMLGGETPPKDIREAAGFDRVFLEIRTNVGDVWTFERGLKGGAANLYKTAYSKITANSSPQQLTGNKHAKREDNVSQLLMLQAGFPSEVKISKNKSNTKITLSIRTLLHFFMVGETAIQAELSPIFDGNTNNRTSNMRIFEYLLTGTDDAAIVTKPKPEIVSASTKAKETVFLEIIDQTRSELEGIRARLRGAPTVEELSASIERFQKDLDLTNESISEKVEVKQALLLEQTEVSSRAIAIDELLERFSLLKKQYLSDLQRLEFLKEGNYILGQLQPAICVSCGHVLVSSAHSHKQEGSLDASFTDAYEKEYSRTTLLLKDLDDTFASLFEERSDINEEIEDLNAAIGTVHTELMQLTPVFSKVRSQLSSLFEIQRTYDLETSASARLVSLTQSMAAVKFEARSMNVKTTEEVEAEIERAMTVDQGIMEFCLLLEAILKEWHFSENPKVSFDKNPKVADIIVDGTPRQNNGKGTRALLHSAFIVALRDFCIKKGRPHPGFIVLDSPLTTLKEPKPGEKNEDVSPEVQSAFFRYFANRNDIQVIILENKEPDPNLSRAAHITEFTKRNALNERYGFLPPLKQ